MLALLLAAHAPLAAQTRHSRSFGADDGLIPAFVMSVAQDSAGQLWIGTGGGLYRYDGVAMRHWAPESLRTWVSSLTVSPGGTVVAVEDSRGAVYEVAGSGIRAVIGPGDTTIADAISAAFDRGGGLWVARRDALLHRDVAGAWVTIPRDRLGGAALRRVVTSPRGGVLVITREAVWRAESAGALSRILPVDNPVDALLAPDDRLYVATFGGQAGVIEDGRLRVLAAYPNRAISLALRQGSLWVSYDHHLLVLGPGGTAERLGLEDGVNSGGPLLVDHEGSLWLGTSNGLVQFPEPDTRIWTERHGLPSRHTRFLARTGDTIWVSTWRGSAGLTPQGGTWQAWTPKEWTTFSRPVVDPRGDLWVASHAPTSGLYTVRAGRAERRYALTGSLFRLATGPDERTWLATSQGLLVASKDRVDRYRGTPFGADTVFIHGVLIDRTGHLWVASDRRVCHAPAPRAADTAPAPWSCDEVADGHHVSSLLQVPSGALWATMVRSGIWRHSDSGWTELPGTQRLIARDMQNLVLARDSGVWLVGTGSVIRVLEDPGTPDGWRELERIVAWHGVQNDGVNDLLEADDGALWLATTAGLVRIAPDARRARPAAPRVVLGEVRVNGVAVAADAPVELAHDQNRLELRFAAVSFRDPSLLRYEVRLSPGDRWDRVQGEPVFRWVDLRPGSYRAEVRASLDGVAWTRVPTRFDFRVLRPWYLTPFALAAFTLVVLATLTAIYRGRVAFLLELERQRTRIAMDLHDEMGSGLGSIGILSSMLSSGRVERGEDARLAGEIARTAGELGTALSGIVWSLTPRAGTLEEMAGRLAEYGRRLSAGGAAEFSTSFPAVWPETPLRPAVRRNVLLIVLEALHNVGRHAHAGRVELRISCDRPEWTIAVKDDGAGMGEPDPSPPRGLGIASMRERAAEIGAAIEVRSTPGAGTAVVLAFDPQGRSRRWRRLTRRERVT